MWILKTIKEEVKEIEDLNRYLNDESILEVYKYHHREYRRMKIKHYILTGSLIFIGIIYLIYPLTLTWL